MTRTGIEFRRFGYRFPVEFQNKAMTPVNTEEPGESQQNPQAVQLLNKAGCMSCHSIDPNSEGRSLLGVGAKKKLGVFDKFENPVA